ncbi:MAG: glycosyltransferase N-terminal domain-containing protein [Elusimicrobiota bacterium]|nr:glycosyltransferase N-terminal domain-containing protein [Elusimicrobiota bacterium]
MIYFYQLIFTFIFILFLPAGAVLILIRPDFRAYIHERLGIYPSHVKEIFKKSRLRCWVHAASVGEIKLLNKIPGITGGNIVITTTTVSGRALGKKMYPNIPVLLMPLDFIFLIKRFIRMASVGNLIVLETELWPAFIYANRKNSPVLLNGRLAKDKFKIYYFLRNYFLKIFNIFSAIYPKDRRNFARFKKIGVSNNILKEPLNLKFMDSRPEIDSTDKRYRRPRQPVIVCGSTHTGEDQILADIYKGLLSDFNELTLILSPRHLNRIDNIKSMLSEKNIKYKLWSLLAGSVPEGTAVVIDSMGELSKIYSLADIAFIGGSIVPRGGHNIIEAALWGVPAVSGRFVDNFQSVYNIFIQNNAVRIARNRGTLHTILSGFLRESSLRQDIGSNGFELVKREKDKIEERLKEISREIF